MNQTTMNAIRERLLNDNGGVMQKCAVPKKTRDGTLCASRFA